jgi:hypothetical protein
MLFEKIKKLMLSIAILVLVSNVSLHAEFEISAQLHPRGEYRTGYGRLKTESDVPAVLISHRSRITFSLDTTRTVWKFILQDVRIWGDETLYRSTGVFGDNASLDVHEAWAGIKIKEASTLKSGRQPSIYDDERLLASGDWNQYAVTYDVLCYQYHPGRWEFDICLSLLNSQENVFSNIHPLDKLKIQNLLHLQRSFANGLLFSFKMIGSGYTASDSSEVIYLRGTYGLFARYRHQNLMLATAAYYQNGKNQEGNDVSAYLFTGDFSTSFSLFSPAMGLVYLSGQDGLNANPKYQKTDHLFDILYGARLRYYGLLDYFTNIPKSTANGGLIDFFFRLDVNYARENYLRADYHTFYLQNNVPYCRNCNDPIEALEKFLGSEIDFMISQSIINSVKLRLGYSFYHPTESMKILQNASSENSEFSNWAWIMWNLPRVSICQKNM